MIIRNSIEFLMRSTKALFFKTDIWRVFLSYVYLVLSKYVDFSKYMSIICIKSSNQNAMKTRDSSFSSLMREVRGKVFHNEPPRRVEGTGKAGRAPERRTGVGRCGVRRKTRPRSRIFSGKSGSGGGRSIAGIGSTTPGRLCLGAAGGLRRLPAKRSPNSARTSRVTFSELRTFTIFVMSGLRLGSRRRHARATI